MTISLSALPDHVVAFLRGGQSVVMATVDPTGQPFTTIMTWVVARDSRTLAFAVDQRGRATQNIRANGKVAFEILGDGINYGCRGRARVVRETMAATPFPSSMVEVAIEEVRDHTSPGVIYKGPSYTFAGDKQHRIAVEQAIFAELLQQ